SVATKSSNGSKVLDDYNFGTADGTNVCQWTYGGNNNQMWVFEPTNN
ncbi:RICIN domain-containing protein, partial [Clostridium acetobutylicum]